MVRRNYLKGVVSSKCGGKYCNREWGAIAIRKGTLTIRYISTSRVREAFFSRDE